ncbi:hypothetical protein MRX96_036471 [Rhipicephalus microplus]
MWQRVGGTTWGRCGNGYERYVVRSELGVVGSTVASAVRRCHRRCLFPRGLGSLRGRQLRLLELVARPGGACIKSTA